MSGNGDKFYEDLADKARKADSKVVPLSEFALDPALKRSVSDFEKELLAAMKKAKDNGIPRGFLVAVLHGHALMATQEMMNNG
jgi:hypothetical protein